MRISVLTALTILFAIFGATEAMAQGYSPIQAQIPSQIAPFPMTYAQQQLIMQQALMSQQTGANVPFVMPPNGSWMTGEMSGMPNFLGNPNYVGQTQSQPNMQDPWSLTAFDVPSGTRVHKLSDDRSDRSSRRERDTSDDSEAKVEVDNVPGDKGTQQFVHGQYYVPTKDLGKDLGGGKYQFTKTVRAISRTAVQNDQNSKTEAGPGCVICKQLQQQSSLYEARLNAIMASKQVPQKAFADAKACYMRMLNDGKLRNPNFMTVIDYNQPSNSPRLYLIDLRANTDKVIQRFIVSQGDASSGGAGGEYAVSYSNAACSNRTSPGCYLTGELYEGEYFAGRSKTDNPPKSLRLDGEDPGVNDNARARDIVAHGYQLKKGMNPNDAADTWGCFGLGTNQDIVDWITHSMANGGAWYAEKMTGGKTDNSKTACHSTSAVIAKTAAKK